MFFEINGVTKQFGGLTAVGGLSFGINEGEILSVIGPNGAGKSTVFNLITGFHQPDEGRITLMGENITGLKPFAVARQGIARTFQSTTVFTRDTVFDNLVIGYRLRTRAGFFRQILGTPLSRAEEKASLAKAEELIAFLGLERHQNELASNIPQEAQKRLSVGIALATEPKLLLLDEPTGGVNLEENDKLIRIIQDLQKRGVTICLIEHKMKMVMNISDRVVVLSYGRKIAEGAPGAVSQNAEVIEAYLGPGYAA